MTVLTILNHGTANSTDRVATSEGCMLVISQIAELLAGVEDKDWMLTEGAGTAKLRDTGVNSSAIAGIGGGKGVEDNVVRAVRWIKERRAQVGSDVTVNLAGHSRGSITCYKIARALCNDASTSRIPINIFAIDPVPGNTGDAFTKNGENYKNIILGGNVWRGNSYLLLAESEHRLVFRPYVDALYSVGMKDHKFDTIPGTHGGINMLDGGEHEAAAIVLSRALRFLQKNASPMKNTVDSYILDGRARLGKYAELMCRIKKYKRDASVNPLKGGVGGVVNFAMSGFQVERHRVANVHGKKNAFGPESLAEDNGKARRGDFHGLNLGKAIGQMSGSEAHATRPHRFFCNLDHQTLFAKTYATLYETVRTLERSGVGGVEKAKIRSRLLGECSAAYNSMQGAEKVYFDRFLAKRGIDLAG
jgi:hypothetical protein